MAARVRENVHSLEFFILAGVQAPLSRVLVARTRLEAHLLLRARLASVDRLRVSSVDSFHKVMCGCVCEK